MNNLLNDLWVKQLILECHSEFESQHKNHEVKIAKRIALVALTF